MVNNLRLRRIEGLSRLTQLDKWESWVSELWLLTYSSYAFSISHMFFLIKPESMKTTHSSPFHGHCLSDGWECGWLGAYLVTRG